ncbi:MAG TPA: metal ABC transporter substrate-binding protein, partial [Ruminococcaceae bacterium]|nr:metal ABC transporter substrate-binding protein [Oscillospiraceae bacterium]
MKKVVSLISALLLSLTLAACGNNASNPMQSALDTRQADLKAK